MTPSHNISLPTIRVHQEKYSSPHKIQGYVKDYLNEKAPRMESKYNLSSINASDEEFSTGEATYENLIRFKDADLQKLNKNPLN